MAGRIQRAYNKYRLAQEILRNSGSVIKPGAERSTRNLQDWAHVMKATWEEFTERLTEKQRELVEELTHSMRRFFTRGEKYVLRDINRVAKKMGLW